MGPVYFVIALMSCGDDGAACATARVAPATYATADQCAAATRAVLAANSDIDAPVLTAECRTARGARAASAATSRASAAPGF